MINADRSPSGEPLSRRLPAAALAVTLMIAGLITATPQAVAEPECLHPSYDFDGDHTLDPVIGIPGGAGHVGAVEVRISNEDEPKVLRLKGPNGFGSVVGQLSSYANEGDDQLCSQLVVGSPKESVDGKAGAGAVYVYAWNGDGFIQRGRYTAGRNGVPGTSQAGAHFGATLASTTRAQDEIDPQPQRLYVGVPGEDVGSTVDAGRVTSFVLGVADNSPASDGRTVSYATTGVPGAATTRGALGSAISVSHGLVAIGAPGQPVGGVAGGAVLVLPDRGNRFAPYSISQATTGIPGSVEAGDRFGAAVNLSGDEGDTVINLVIGVPGEDLGSISNAGSAAQVPIRTDTGQSAPGAIDWTQDSAGSEGKAEAGDAFGSAVTGYLFVDYWLYFIGVPGEDINGHRDAGLIQMFGEDGGQAYSQASDGFPGSNETGDRFGAAVSGLMIGVPGENNGAGAVIRRRENFSLDAVRYSAPSSAADHYGAAVAP